METALQQFLAEQNNPCVQDITLCCACCLLLTHHTAPMTLLLAQKPDKLLGQYKYTVVPPSQLTCKIQVRRRSPSAAPAASTSCAFSTLGLS